MSVDNRGNSVGRVVEAVHKLKAERDKQRKAEHDQRQTARQSDSVQVVADLYAYVSEAADQRKEEDRLSSAIARRFTIGRGEEHWRRRHLRSLRQNFQQRS